MRHTDDLDDPVGADGRAQEARAAHVLALADDKLRGAAVAVCEVSDGGAGGPAGRFFEVADRRAKVAQS